MYNSDFKVVGLHTFVLSVSEWIEKTGAIGLVVKKGRYGGTLDIKILRNIRLRYWVKRNISVMQ